jgi:hypothetical protein
MMNAADLKDTIMKQFIYFIAPLSLGTMLCLSGCKETPPQPTASSSKARNSATAATAPAAVNPDDLGVKLPSLDELRAKATQSINADNADAEFDKLLKEIDAEAGTSEP